MLSVIIPVYKSAATIGRLVEKVLNDEEAVGVGEIVLVNDGSPDNTGAICRDIVGCYPGRVRLVELAKNFGEHNAVMAGLKCCQGDIAVIIDDDFQNPPSEIKHLVSKIKAGAYDVVYGVYSRKCHSWFRKFGSWFNGIIATVALGKPRGVYLSSFKALNRFIINEILRYDLPYPYIDGLIFRVTNRIGSVVVKHEPRREGKSNYTLVKLIRLWLNMLTNFTILPLRLATALGAVTLLFGFILSCFVCYWIIIGKQLPSGWPSLLCSSIIFSGAQLISIGLIGEYVGRLFLGHNGRPQYVIREIVERK